MRRTAVILLGITLALSGLLVVRLQMQKRALHGPAGGSAEIEGTEVRLASRLTARIVKQAVRKGATVRRGDLVVALDCTEAQAMLAEADSRLAQASAQAKASRSQAEASRRQQVAARASAQAARAQAEALKAQRDAAERQADRMESVAKDVAFANRDQLRASAVGLGHQVEAARASGLATSEQSQAALDAMRAAAAQADAASSAIRTAQAARDRAQILVDECQLRAPRDAWVEELTFEEGELVSPGSILARLVDLREVKATFYLPNAEVAAARVGGLAVVVADAYPDERFAGHVTSVAMKAEFTPRNIQTRTDRDRLVYPVEVTIPNPTGKLRPGMPVDVRLVGTER